MSVTLEEIVAARARIAGGIEETPCTRSARLSELCGAEIFCKLEYLHRTGSFKERGARNALMLLAPEQKARGGRNDHRHGWSAAWSANAAADAAHQATQMAADFVSLFVGGPDCARTCAL